MAFLPATPQQVDLETEDTIAAASDSKSTDPVKDLAPIGFFRAFRIPNVAQYALAFGFFKLINYALFFWLPYFLAQHYTPEQSNLISTLYDVGMMPGGIIVGYVSDLYGGRRACVIVTFMFLLVPLLILFSQAADTLPALALLVLLGFMGVLVGGPNNIITSAVSADLAEHPDVKGNSRALGTVTGIINGSGSITAAIGLLFIGPMQVSWGWDSVWYFLIVCTVLGTLLISRMVYFELYPKSEAEDAPNGYHSVQTGESKA
jgi:sugar phosphate permease